MATETVYITGKCKWAKLKTPDTAFDEQGWYSINVYPDADGWAKLKAVKSSLRKREDEDGEFVGFRRKVAGPAWEPVLGPPKVVDKDNNIFDGLVGNGSTVTVKVDFYPAGKYVGHRLETVRVDNLVVYEKPSDAEGVPVDPPVKAAAEAPAPKITTKKAPF